MIIMNTLFASRYLNKLLRATYSHTCYTCYMGLDCRRSHNIHKNVAKLACDMRWQSVLLFPCFQVPFEFRIYERVNCSLIRPVRPDCTGKFLQLQTGRRNSMKLIDSMALNVTILQP